MDQSDASCVDAIGDYVTSYMNCAPDVIDNGTLVSYCVFVCLCACVYGSSAQHMFWQWRVVALMGPLPAQHQDNVPIVCGALGKGVVLKHQKHPSCCTTLWMCSCYSPIPPSQGQPVK